jgi:hypothetical protein
MKRVVLIVPDTFDVGSIISLIGMDLAQAYIGDHHPKIKLGTPSEDEQHTEPERIVTGRIMPERKVLPGFDRPGSQGATRPQRLEGKTIREHILEMFKDGAWYLVSDIETRLVTIGYKMGSAHKMLSTMRIKGEVEKTGKSTQTRYRKRVELMVVKNEA